MTKVLNYVALFAVGVANMLFAAYVFWWAYTNVVLPVFPTWISLSLLQVFVIKLVADALNVDLDKEIRKSVVQEIPELTVEQRWKVAITKPATLLLVWFAYFAISLFV